MRVTEIMANRSLASPPMVGSYGPPASPRIPTDTRGHAELSLQSVILFLLAHAALGPLMNRFEVLATVHAWLAILLCLLIATFGRNWESGLMACAYISGSEVLWRATEAGFFWEGAKYAVALVALVTALRHRNRSASPWALIFFALLVPGALVTIFRATPAELRSLLSFNLSGPFVLAIFAWAFGFRSISLTSLARVAIAFAAPILALGMVASLGTVKLNAEDFGTSSNFAASGGFGPNQVSAALGLGALCMFFFSFLFARRPVRASLGISLVVYFLVQSAITFSRTGLYLGVICIGVLCLGLLWSPRYRWVTFLLGFSSSVLIAGALLWLNLVTVGKLGERFADLRTTGRDQIALTDLQIGLAHFPLGAGAGLAPKERSLRFGNNVACHTEYTRIFAEHGIFGIAACICTGFLVWRRLRITPDKMNTAFSVAFILYTALFMATSAFRLSFPAFTFGLALITLKPKSGQPDGKRSSCGRGMPLTLRAGPAESHRNPAR